MEHMTTIREARDDDYPVVATLLTDAGLPLEDVREHFGNFLIAERDGTIAGAVGLEQYGTEGLFRSLVVHPGSRKDGTGTKLTSAMISKAQAMGIHRLFLLTTSAAEFFARRGFTVIERCSVKGDVSASHQFTSCCCNSAVTMMMEMAKAVDRIPVTGNRPTVSG